MTSEEWLLDIGRAVDELGYGIVRLEPNSITLTARRHPDVEIEITSVFLSGESLRRWLRPIRSGEESS